MENGKIFSVYPSPEGPQQSLPDLCTSLLETQYAGWPKLREGMDALRQSAVREIECRGYSVLIQYNPHRIISTAAKVDEQSIAKRRCFLCSAHLPPEQKGIVCRTSYVMLANPIPIFSRHFTLARREHSPQEFERYLDDFLTLAADLGPALALFYNGPRCGASAPDHMHFQVYQAGTLPIERDLNDPSRLIVLKTEGDSTFSMVRDYGRGVIVLSSVDRDTCGEMIRRIFKVVRELCNEPEEPMMNIIGHVEKGRWRVIIFPRKRHRPSVYFADDRVVISPAAVDMAGLIITPVEKDYRTLTAGLVESIYHEVAVSPERVQKYIEMI